MRIYELTNLQEDEQRVGKWTIKTMKQPDGSFGGLAFVEKDRTQKTDVIYSKTEEEVVSELKRLIRDKAKDGSSEKPNINAGDVTKTVGNFNVQVTREIFDGYLPGMVKIVDDGAVYLDFVPASYYEEDDELKKILVDDGFKSISSRDFGDGDNVYKTSLTPNQVTQLGLEFSGIYGLDKDKSPDPDFERYKLTSEPIDYLEGKKNPKIHPFPTFSIPTWTKGASVNEERDPEGDYEEVKAKGEIDRVIKTLSGNQSGVFTRMAKEYKELDALMNAYQDARNAWNDTMKGHIEASFDPADEAYTRVIETASMTITMSKQVTTADKETVDWEKVAKGLLEQNESLQEHFDQLTKAFTKVTKGSVRQGSLMKPKFKDKVNEGVMDFVTNFFGKVKSYVKNWANRFDAKTAQIKAMMPQTVNEDEMLDEESVLSSWIEDLTWDDPDIVMTLNNGRDYTIHNVPFGVYEEWVDSSSKGRFWHGYIKDDYMVT